MCVRVLHTPPTGTDPYPRHALMSRAAREVLLGQPTRVCVRGTCGVGVDVEGIYCSSLAQQHDRLTSRWRL